MFDEMPERSLRRCTDLAKSPSRGALVWFANIFYELEPGRVDYYRRVFGRKAWHMGPIFSLLVDKVEGKGKREMSRGFVY